MLLVLLHDKMAKPLMIALFTYKYTYIYTYIYMYVYTYTQLQIAHKSCD